MHTEHYSKKNIHCNKLSLSFILYLKEYYLRQTWFLHRWYLLLVFFLIGKYFLRVCSPVFSAQQQQKKRNEPSGNRFGGGDCTHRVSTPRGALPSTVRPVQLASLIYPLHLTLSYRACIFSLPYFWEVTQTCMLKKWLIQMNLIKLCVGDLKKIKLKFWSHFVQIS